MLSVDECWDFLESQIGGPSVLPPGASPSAISRAEATMQVEFPDDLRRYLTRHDGSGDFFISPYKIGGGGQMLMALEGIVAIWHHLVDAAVDLEKSGEFGEQIGPVKQNYWNRRWVPFTENGCGDYIFVDLDPGNDGTVGQIVDWWHEKAQSTFQSASLREWLNEVVGEIKKGVYTFGNT